MIRSYADQLCSCVTKLILVGDMGKRKLAPAETWVPAPLHASGSSGQGGRSNFQAWLKPELGCPLRLPPESLPHVC